MIIADPSDPIDSSPSEPPPANGLPRSAQPNEELRDRLMRAMPSLRRFLSERARRLVALESIEDLLQGLIAHVLEVEGRFQYRGEEEFLGWLRKVAKQHIANRARYWRVRKNVVRRLLREPSSSEPGGRLEPILDRMGPVTLALLKEEVLLLTKTLSLLLPRDQKILACVAQGGTLEDVAELLAVGHEAAKKARQRALGRLQELARTLGDIERSSRASRET